MKGRKKRKALAATVLFLIFACVFSCSQDTGPDAISSHEGQPPGTLPSDCEGCHLSPDLPGINPLSTNGSGTAGKHVVHYSTRGFECEKCHLGYSASATHFDGTLDTGDPLAALVSFDATNPAGQWISDTGPQTGQCTALNCHGPDTLDWYGTAGWILPACDVCHAAAMGTRRAVTGVSGDFILNTTVASHHVAGGSDPTDAQCTVCHELSQHMAGEVRLIEADTVAVIVSNSLDPSGLEPYCLACHDSDGANGDMSPFADGETLGVAPFRMSAEIDTHWNRAYGHRREGLTCVGTGDPDTGCHANGHGSAFTGILAKNLTLPKTTGLNGFEIADEPEYEMCFSCHQSYPRVTKEVILGVMAGGNYDWDHYWSWIGGPSNPPYFIANITTGFRDKNFGTGGYDDAPWYGSYLNLHFWHLEDGGWNYRETTAAAVSCTTCHNVHGSDTLWGWVYDEMEWAHYNGVGSDEYALMNAVNIMSFPVNCTRSCHTSAGGATSMWFEPPDE